MSTLYTPISIFFGLPVFWLAWGSFFPFEVFFAYTIGARNSGTYDLPFSTFDNRNIQHFYMRALRFMVLSKFCARMCVCVYVTKWCNEITRKRFEIVRWSQGVLANQRRAIRWYHFCPPNCPQNPILGGRSPQPPRTRYWRQNALRKKHGLAVIIASQRRAIQWHYYWAFNCLLLCQPLN